jgi:hypothetical protein
MTDCSAALDRDGLVIRLLRNERDRIAREIDISTLVWSEPDCPEYAWFDRAKSLAGLRVSLAAANAAIARRLPSEQT